MTHAVKKVRFPVVVLLLVSGLAFHFIAGQSAAAASKQVTLSAVCYYTTETGKAFLFDLFRKYEEQNPAIKIEAQLVTLGKWPEIMQARAMANDLPDVALSGFSWVGVYAGMGRLLDGTKYIPPDILKRFKPSCMPVVEFDGKIFGLPWASSPRAAAYNVDHFQQAGVKAPRNANETWTWTELVEAAKKIQSSAKAKYGLQFEKASLDGWMPFLYQAGGSLTTDNFAKPAVNTPPGIRALEWVIDLHKKGIAAPGIFEGTEDPLRLFVSGISAMWLATGNWMIPALEAQMKNFRYDFTFLPRDVCQATVPGGPVWMVFKGKYPKEAWDLVLYVTNVENMARYCSIHTSIPTRFDVQAQWERPELERFFAEQGEFVPPQMTKELIHPFYSAARTRLLQEIAMAVSGQKTASQAAIAMDAIIAETLRTLR